MIIGIHPDRLGKESYSERWTAALQARGIETRPVDLLASDALQQVAACDGVMWRFTHYPKDKLPARRILYVIEHELGRPVFPNWRTAWHYDDKLAQFYLLQSLQAPLPRTWIFWDYAAAQAWSKTAPYPLIFKLSTGSGSSNVLKVEHPQQAERLMQHCFRDGFFPYTVNEWRTGLRLPRDLHGLRSLGRRLLDAAGYVLWGRYPILPGVWWLPEKGYAYFQEFLPGNEFDTRITVIGERAFAYRRLNRPGDFRASGSGRFVNDPDPIDRRCIQIAFDISRRGGFQCMAYDFLMLQGQPRLNEMSYTFVDWMVAECPGHWNPALEWQDGKLWPEEAQAEDFITMVQNHDASRL